jgi:hypothetical protein
MRHQAVSKIYVPCTILFYFGKFDQIEAMIVLWLLLLRSCCCCLPTCQMHMRTHKICTRPMCMYYYAQPALRGLNIAQQSRILEDQTAPCVQQNCPVALCCMRRPREIIQQSGGAPRAVW